MDSLKKEFGIEFLDRLPSYPKEEYIFFVAVYLPSRKISTAWSCLAWTYLAGLCKGEQGNPLLIFFNPFIFPYNPHNSALEAESKTAPKIFQIDTGTVWDMSMIWIWSGRKRRVLGPKVLSVPPRIDNISAFSGVLQPWSTGTQKRSTATKYCR